MINITNLGQVDTFKEFDSLIAPLVIREKTEDGKIIYAGFIPGIIQKDVLSESLEECKKELNENSKLLFEKMLKNNEPFPFFPNKEDIINNFDNVCYIKLIKIK